VVEVRGFNLGRLVFALLVAIYGFQFVLNRDAAMTSFLHHPALAIHEGGHYFVFAWAPEFLMILGGSLTQCVLPLMFAVYFWRSGQRYAACITMFWVAFNLIDTAVYIGDARSQELPLIFGEDSIHDWNYLLSATGLLQADGFLAGLTHIVGILCYILSVAGGIWFARGDAQGWWWQREPDSERLPVQRLRNIGARSATLLESIGVKTRGDLVNLGALEAYRQLLEAGAKPSFSLLYALHGAITDRDWNKLSDKEKTYLREEAAAFETSGVP
jgi:TfoX C-terminal domain